MSVAQWHYIIESSTTSLRSLWIVRAAFDGDRAAVPFVERAIETDREFFYGSLDDVFTGNGVSCAVLALQALDAIDPPGATDRLFAVAIGDPDPPMRYAAAQLLVRRDARFDLRTLQGHPDELVRYLGSAASLARAEGRREVVPEWYDSPPEDLAREAIRTLADALADPSCSRTIVTLRPVDEALGSRPAYRGTWTFRGRRYPWPLRNLLTSQVESSLSPERSSDPAKDRASLRAWAEDPELRLLVHEVRDSLLSWWRRLLERITGRRDF